MTPRGRLIPSCVSPKPSHQGIPLWHNTPTHASWLNQIVLWFSIMQRRLIRHGEIDSSMNLANRIIEFTKSYNCKAKPFRWTYEGRPLQSRKSH